MTIFLMFFLMFVVTLSPNKGQPDTEAYILGIWVYDGEGADGKGSIFLRSEHFNRDREGLHFKEGGVLVKRQNFGWCGTAPVQYTNDRGRWKLRENTLSITYPNWNGEQHETWRIVSVDERRLLIDWVGR